MDIEYVYTKIRRNFGKKCMFSDDGPRIMEDVFPDDRLMKKYIVRNPVSKGTQLTQVMSENQVNTAIMDYSDHGMTHVEGGWPKEINKADEEAVLRFRKKVQRLDYYVAAMKHVTVPMEHAILQNNAINIYEQYFKKNKFSFFLERVSCRVQNAFRDLHEKPRPVTHCSWSPKNNEFAMSHCYMDYQHPQTINCPQCYVWDIENPNTPTMTFGHDNPIVTLEYNPKDPNILVAGMFNGQITSFDPRKGAEPTSGCLVEHSHREPVHSVLWVNTKSGMECFSTSNDGVIKWWDCRKLDEPIDFIFLEMSRDGSKSAPYPASCLEYEQSIPSKYMVGTQNGHVICGNRRGTNQQEKLPWIMKCHYGPIYSVHRNQAMTKHFLTVGDWTARIWTEDCKESAILWTKYHKAKLTGGEWSSGRVSVFFLAREDGVLDLWDILEEQKLAFLSLKLCEQPLTCLRVREDGELVVAASTAGTAYVVRYSSNLAETSKDDRVFLSAMFDREAHREKLLESKNKELRLRLREIAIAKETPEKPAPVVVVNPLKEEIEEKYLNAIEDALHNLGGVAVPSKLHGFSIQTQHLDVKDLEEEEVEEEEEEEEFTENNPQPEKKK